MRGLGPEKRHVCLDVPNRTWREAQKIVTDTINRELSSKGSKKKRPFGRRGWIEEICGLKFALEAS